MVAVLCVKRIGHESFDCRHAKSQAIHPVATEISCAGCKRSTGILERDLECSGWDSRKSYAIKAVFAKQQIGCGGGHVEVPVGVGLELGLTKVGVASEHQLYATDWLLALVADRSGEVDRGGEAGNTS